MAIGLSGHNIYPRPLFLTLQFFFHQGAHMSKILSRMDSTSPHDRNCGSQYRVNVFLQGMIFAFRPSPMSNQIANHP